MYAKGLVLLRVGFFGIIMEQKCLIYLFVPFASAQVQVDVCIFTPTNFWIDIFGRVLWIYVLS